MYGDKEKLGQMVDAFIKDKPEESQIAFHDYAGGVMKGLIHGTQESGPEDGEED